jgi:hypothetical protein
MAQRAVNRVFTTTTPIRYRDEQGGGTGFYLNYNGRTFIVTNRHVVKPDDEEINPTEAYIWLRNATEVVEANRSRIQLVKDGSPTYFEHPEFPEDVDIALIPINPRLSSLDDSEDLNSGSLAFTPDHFIHENIKIDQRVSVIGYPGDFVDKATRFPVRRNALIASPYGIWFEENPFFVTDARMHPGTSGSPVVMEGTLPVTQGDVPDHRIKNYYLLGVHSATFYGASLKGKLTNSEDEQKESHAQRNIQLDLNVVWYPDLVSDILGNIDFPNSD